MKNLLKPKFRIGDIVIWRDTFDKIFYQCVVEHAYLPEGKKEWSYLVTVGTPQWSSVNRGKRAFIGEKDIARKLK